MKPNICPELKKWSEKLEIVNRVSPYMSIVQAQYLIYKINFIWSINCILQVAPYSKLDIEKRKNIEKIWYCFDCISISSSWVIIIYYSIVYALCIYSIKFRIISIYAVILLFLNFSIFCKNCNFFEKVNHISNSWCF